MHAVLVDRADLARVGPQHTMPRILEEAARPRAVHSHLHHHQGPGVSPAQRGEAGARVGDGFLLDDLAPGIEHADGVLAVSEVDPDRDGCPFRFHGSMKITHEASHGPAAFSSILVLSWLGIGGSLHGQRRESSSCRASQR